MIMADEAIQPFKFEFVSDFELRISNLNVGDCFVASLLAMTDPGVLNFPQSFHSFFNRRMG